MLSNTIITMVEFVGILDFIFVPLYFAIILAILFYIKKKNPTNLLIQRYLIKGFIFKAICCIFYCLLMYFYYGYGDTLSYYREAMEVKQFIARGEADLGVLFKNLEFARYYYDIEGGAEAGWLLEKITLVLSYFCFDRFLVISLVIGTLAYAGMFKMLQAFVTIMPEWHKPLVLLVLFFPTVTIYGSGIMKDTICLSALGWIIYCSHTMLINKRFKLKYVLIILFCCILIGIMKIYIIAAFLIPFAVYLMINSLSKIKNPIIRNFLKPVMAGFMIVIYLAFSQNIQNALGSYATEKILDTVKSQQENYKKLEDESGSFFEIGPMEESLSGFLKKVPLGIVTTLYRPFIWESRNVMMLFSAMESLCILLLTIYTIIKTGLFKFIHYVFSDSFIFLCIFYSILFAALVGVSTLNFGTLARYRIPILPFYIAGLLYALYLNYKKPLKVSPQD